ncbi:hypothetical protein QO008_000624 [Peptoniphilus ivorii]|uniref:hypothetical protein n=1 Tax=Aedoeadaptatus ivorii TaxID=54006 RepID=UPI00278874F7|nr:hypothetical protein [Peptoniphilus ivorii]MDQ0508175.1 hypothetical protein [Peptoniphilus ivorii]
MELKSLHDELHIDADSLRLREILRYLRLEGTAPDAELLDAVRRNAERLLAVADIRKVAALVPLSLEGGALAIGDLRVHSEALLKNLSGCDRALLFAVTLGAGVDRLIRRLTVVSKYDAFITDAAATEVLESYANAFCRAVDREARTWGYSLKPRFSPGFADFGLAYQWPLIRALRADTKIHISLTRADMLVPAKTITAVAGLLPKEREI